MKTAKQVGNNPLLPVCLCPENEALMMLYFETPFQILCHSSSFVSFTRLILQMKPILLRIPSKFQNKYELWMHSAAI
jgi:hypothetical protein